jgi:hypothetical protein
MVAAAEEEAERAAKADRLGAGGAGGGGAGAGGGAGGVDGGEKRLVALGSSSRLPVSQKSPWADLREAVFKGEAQRIAKGQMTGASGTAAQVATAARAGPEALLKFLVERAQSREALMWSFDALSGLLAGNEEARRVMFRENGIGKVLFGVRRFLWDEEVLANGFKALNALAADYPKECGAQGAVEVIVEGMSHCDTDYQVQVRGTTALSTLIREEANKDRARAAGADKVIVAALEANPEDGQMQWRGIQMLEALKPGGGQALKQKAIKRAQTSAVMRSMSKMSLTGGSAREIRPADVAAHEAALKEVLENAETVDDEDD